MNRILLLSCALVLSALHLSAEPVVGQGGILNVASYALNGLPNSGVAQGAMFIIFGERLGPAGFSRRTVFPYPPRKVWQEPV